MVGYGGSQQNTPASYMSPIHIKQEDDKTIQIPQVTSMTSSPDSSPSPQVWPLTQLLPFLLLKKSLIA